MSGRFRASNGFSTSTSSPATSAPLRVTSVRRLALAVAARSASAFRGSHRRARSDGYREAAGKLADAAGRLLASRQVLKDAMAGTGTEAETALANPAASAGALTAELNDTTAAAERAGATASKAGACSSIPSGWYTAPQCRPPSA